MSKHRSWPPDYNPIGGPPAFIETSAGAADADKGVKTDVTGKLDISTLPASVVGEMTYKGLWDASGGGTPAGTDNGDFYVVSVDGTIDPAARPVQVGDTVIYNDSSLQYDIIDSGGLPEHHASTHEDGGTDEVEIANLATTEMTLYKTLQPNGTGGLAWVDSRVMRTNQCRYDPNAVVDTGEMGNMAKPFDTLAKAIAAVKIASLVTADKFVIWADGSSAEDINPSASDRGITIAGTSPMRTNIKLSGDVTIDAASKDVHFYNLWYDPASGKGITANDKICAYNCSISMDQAQCVFDGDLTLYFSTLFAKNLTLNAGKRLDMYASRLLELGGGTLTINGGVYANEGCAAWELSTIVVQGPYSDLKNYVFKGNQAHGVQQLVDAATIAWDCKLGAFGHVTATANRIVGLPTNLVEGEELRFEWIQDGVGGWLPTFNVAFKFPGGVVPAVDLTAGASTLFSFVYRAALGIVSTDQRVPVPYDESGAGLVTSSDGDQATAMLVGFTPVNGGYVKIGINFDLYEPSGDKLGACYFSDDAGATAKARDAVKAADGLYWNGSVAGFQLDSNDVVAFVYDK